MYSTCTSAQQMVDYTYKSASWKQLKFSRFLHLFFWKRYLCHWTWWDNTWNSRCPDIDLRCRYTAWRWIGCGVYAIHGWTRWLTFFLWSRSGRCCRSCNSLLHVRVHASGFWWLSWRPFCWRRDFLFLTNERSFILWSSQTLRCYYFAKFIRSAESCKIWQKLKTYFRRHLGDFLKKHFFQRLTHDNNILQLYVHWNKMSLLFNYYVRKINNDVKV